MHGEVEDTLDANHLRGLSPALAASAGDLAGAMITTEELGRAMTRVAREGAPKRMLENRDLLALGAP